MATLFRHDFRNETGITITATNGIAGSIREGSLSIFSQDKPTNDWDTNGMNIATGVTGADGHTFYWTMRVASGSPSCIIGLRNDDNITQAGSGFAAVYYRNGVDPNNSITCWNGSSGETGGVVNQIVAPLWHDIRGIIQSDGTIDYYWHLNDLTRFDNIDEGDWTAIGSTTVGATWDATATVVRFADNIFEGQADSARKFDVDSFIYTDDGEITELDDLYLGKKTSRNTSIRVGTKVGI